jgi:hypothetical protein
MPPGPDAGAVATVARFDAPSVGAGAAWGQLPYPSDLFLDANGLLTLTSLPVGAVPNDTAVGYLKDTLHTLDGAGVWSAIYFPLVGGVDEGTLAGHAHLVDLDDPGLAEIPADLRYRADLDAIVVAPKIGQMLREKHRYAAYVTDDVKGADGTAVWRDADFAAAADLSAVPADADVAAAQASLRPLLEALGGDAAAHVVVATVFRTEGVSQDLVAMRDLVAAAPPSPSAIDAVIGPDAAALDAVFGAEPADHRPGMHEAEVVRGQPHQHVAVIVQGRLPIASFMNASDATAGFIQHDANGQPIVQGTPQVKFTLILPKQASWANLPVVIYEHGINRTRADMLVQADTVTAQGMALLAIDIIYHGDRATQPVDAISDVTRVQAPDGFGDVKGLDASVRFFVLTGSGGVPAAHMLGMRSTLQQAAVDLCSLVAFARAGNLAPIATALAAADPGLPADLSFRSDGVALVSESFGSMLAATALAVEPGIHAAVLSVPAGGFPYPTLLHSPPFSGTFSGVILTPFDVAMRVIFGDDVKGARFEPIVRLYDSALESGEPIAYAPYVLDGGLRGGDAPNVLVAEVWSDEWVPNEASEHLAVAMGLPELPLALTMPPPSGGTLRFVALPSVSAPLSGNVAAGTRTAAFSVWFPAAHAMIRQRDAALVYEFDLPRVGEADPFPMRATPLDIVQPIDKLHLQYATFLSTAFQPGGTATIVDPWP